MNKVYALIVAILVFSCEDKVTVDFGEAAELIAVDGILTNLNESQTITLQRTGSYFIQNSTQYIEDANVWVESDAGSIYNFPHTADGNYILPATEVDFQMGINYTLYVELGSDTYTSVSNLERVPPIDSIVWRMESVVPFGVDVDSIIYAQFYARDIDGIGDFFWARAYRNDSLINQQSFNLAWDASPGPGIIFDGDTLAFATPIRQVMTPNGTEFGEIIEQGDKLQIKLLAINEDFAYFITILSEQ
ncbi:DUF4249 family protein, partial [Candidatus Kapabacteria bacterium]|nr:DUF4249 family protein [Candidatus Kapabacteria bacterium]